MGEHYSDSCETYPNAKERLRNVEAEGRCKIRLMGHNCKKQGRPVRKISRVDYALYRKPNRKREPKNNFQTYQLFLSFTYEAPCDVILPRLFYMSIHLPYTFSVLWIEGAQIVMVMERIIAIFYVGQYETCTKKLGNSLLFFSLFFPLTEVIWAYVDETFEEPQISCLNTPDVTHPHKQISILREHDIVPIVDSAFHYTTDDILDVCHSDDVFEDVI
ncbi:hypothetical protein TELCIR_02531 [Teladorsagia circumcincta]|uniref:Uncharacterized protein n=1 Tax=Teladorsagia circumcincta TaxID=45464 RepID=A0A2G9UZ07_TELCI|nr:hypothetical protein TELCIR_02531 [Teladorsagia circumcincta]